jgi:hypothetical protein
MGPFVHVGCDVCFEFFEHLFAVSAGRKIRCLLEGFLREIGEPILVKRTELLICCRSGGRHVFLVEFGNSAAPHADKRL